MVFQNCFITARGKSKIETTGVRSSKFQFIQQGVCKFIFPSKFKMGSMFCDNRGQTSLKRHVTFKEFTPPVIIFSLATAQQTLLILCSVRVSFVLRLHSDAIQVLERLKSYQFKLRLELIESRWRSCLVHLQLTAEPNVIFLALARDGSSSYP